jgi:glycosyltransferase involved in cell wall biosynthesis
MSSTSPTLAVVIPNYNYARFIGQAIESILAQDPPADEVIVVDDASTDDSLAVIRAYEDRVKIITISNSGPLGACHAGLTSSTADYIYFLDADDLALPKLTSKIREAVVSRPAKLQFQLLSMDANGNLSGSRFPVYPNGYDARAAREDNAALGFYLCAVTSANVFSRAALLDFGLDSLNPRDSIDGTPAMVMPYLGDMISLNEPLACYRAHEGSISGWSMPTTELLRNEIVRFNDRWSEALPKLNMSQPPFAPFVPVYVRERQLMIACNEGRLFPLAEFFRFVTGVLRTHLPGKQKLMLSVWASLLLIPIQSHRDNWIKMRRSSAHRSQRMRRILDLVLRPRGSSLTQS